MNPFQLAEMAIRRAVENRGLAAGNRKQLGDGVMGAIEGLLPPPAKAVMRGARVINAGPVANGELDYARAQGWLQ